jgi:type IV pilus assembly protein PilY1
MLFRNRTVTVGGVTNTVKLGDIINSTPRIVSQVAGNLYHKTYFDESYLEFVESDDYQDRGMVFVGANDGMLHAFRLGRLELFNEKNKKAQLHATDLSGTAIVLGDEAWAFVPKNVLPYLGYMADTSYCHLYYVDLTPYIFDASIGTTGCSEADYWECSKYDGTGLPLTDERWRTILIGGMRMGGGCKDPADADTDGVADACTKDMNFDGSIDNDDCALAVDTDKGYSSYFALDITDPTDPSLLWEFSHPSLGFSTTGPAVVRIAAKKGDTNGDGDVDGKDDPDNTRNGRWFVLFGSGSTGPIDTDTHQFKGFSDQNMKVFLLDLEDGSLVRTFDSGIANSFAGSMINAPIDFDQGDSFEHGFYQDDAVYFGFVKAETNPPVATTKWNTGGVMRLWTKNSLDPDSADSDLRWEMNTFINVGPVPSAVAKLQNYKTDEFRLYWGTGRYYYKIAADIDDADHGRRIYGVKEPCYTSTGFDLNCSTTVSAGDLGNANAGATTDDDGWYIDLDSCTDITGATISCADAAAIYKAERTITDTLATPIGGVFFTTTKPTSDICEFGGVSHLWGVDFETGGAISSSVLRGKALLQVSTGSIEEVDLKTAFKQDATDNPYSRNNRRTAAFQGVPPTGSPPGLLLPPDPIDRFIHIREQ